SVNDRFVVTVPALGTQMMVTGALNEWGGSDNSAPTWRIEPATAEDVVEIAPTPLVAAPTPAIDPIGVISLFSSAYTDVTVDTWSTDWDVADVSDVQVAGDDVKLYTNLSYAGIETTTETVDATAMTHFHMDIWTSDPTADPAVFKVKLVDFGADGAWSGGDDTEHELTFMAPLLTTGNWVGIDVPLSDFTGMTAQAHLAQYIISGDPNTVYMDNMYFYDITTGIVGDLVVAPTAFTLNQNYPNPFNPTTTLRYGVPEASAVSLIIYDIRGNVVRTMQSETRPAGWYEVVWNGLDDAGQPVSTGLYLTRLQAGSFNQTIKMLFVK
ncbi:MAG: T9SS type A sorting domain-containing protein, partial [Candidatus Marinimicrobia bacterium]|nr:T9SS type A sorting domain-containing protein [Candidatus Neomarinimicrobiota bacterium]